MIPGDKTIKQTSSGQNTKAPIKTGVSKTRGTKRFNLLISSNQDLDGWIVAGKRKTCATELTPRTRTE